MNRLGIALAADSAVTIGPSAGKIYTSANKLFQLSKKEPVGIMIYGNSDLLQVPWETIIKQYRDQLKDKPFPGLSDYAKDFIRFLKTARRLFPIEEQKKYMGVTINNFFEFIRQEFEKVLEKELNAVKKLTEADIKRIFTNLVSEELSKTKKCARLDGLPSNFKATLGSKYRNVIAAAKRRVFEKLPVSKLTERRLTEIICELFTSKRLEDGGVTGIVVTGFGSEEHFPVLVEITIAGIATGLPLYSQNPSITIGKDADACVVPFAQKEMVLTFMDGIDPDLNLQIRVSTASLFQKVSETILGEVKKKYRRYGASLEKRVDKSLGKLLQQLGQHWEQIVSRDYSDPVMEMVASLPKDELAAMAESLVNLTKFKRRVSKQQETVGGPIDVAVISRGDGFVWVKRKHYFDPKLNPQFLARYNVQRR